MTDRTASNTMDQERSLPARKRRREVLSCEPCRRMKIKCDQKHPCNQCSVRSRVDSCVYSKSSHPPHILDSSSGTGAQTHNTQTPNTQYPNSQVLGPALTPTSLVTTPVSLTYTSPAAEPPQPLHAIQTVSNTRSSLGGANVGNNAVTQHDNERKEESMVAELGLEHDALVKKMKQMEQTIADLTQGRSHVDQAVFETKHREGPVRVTFSKTRLFGQSHWMNFVRQFDKMIGMRKTFLERTDSVPFQMLKKCKEIARQIKAQTSNVPFVHGELQKYIPNREVATELVEAYLRTFESVLRILHVPSFWREFESYWNAPQAASNAFLMQLLLVMAIGTCFQEDQTEEFHCRTSALQWIFAAQAYQSLPSEKSRLNVRGLQIQCLLLIARLANALDADMVWISAGSLLRSAIQMGLHWDPSELPNMSPFQIEMRRRLWATILEIQIQTCMDAGGPPLISCKDFDCRPPSNLDDTQLDENMKDTPEPHPDDVFTQTSILRMLLSSFSVRLRIAGQLNDIASTPDYSNALELHSELSSLLQPQKAHLAKHLHSSTRPSPFDVKMFEFLTYRFALGLHGPWAMKASKNPAYYYSRKVSLDYALILTLQTPLEDFLTTSWQKDDFACVRVHAGGLFRNVGIHAATTITSEIVEQVQESLTSIHSDFQVQAQKDLLKTLTDYIELLTCRVRCGETNVQGPVFIKGIIAQTEAMKAGLPSEPLMMEVFTSCLEVLLGLLTKRLEDMRARSMVEMNGEGQFALGSDATGREIGDNDWAFMDWLYGDGVSWEHVL